MEEKNKKRTSILTGLVVGGAIGSVLSLFLSKKKNRDKTVEISKKIWNSSKGATERFLEKYKTKEK
jgi:gas vesicle protein